MAQKSKSSSTLLFQYLLKAYRDIKFANILKNCGASFSGNFFVWVITICNELLPYDDPDCFETSVYAINPFTSQIYKLASENDEPTSGVLTSDEEVAAQILLDIMQFIQAVEIFKEVTPKRLPSVRLFDLIAGSLQNPQLNKILTSFGTINGNYFVWTFHLDPENFLYYAINPREKVIYNIGTLMQKPDSGLLIDDEREILEILEDILAFIEDNKNGQQVVFSQINPASYKPGCFNN